MLSSDECTHIASYVDSVADMGRLACVSTTWNAAVQSQWYRLCTLHNYWLTSTVWTETDDWARVIREWSIGSLDHFLLFDLRSTGLTVYPSPTVVVPDLSMTAHLWYTPTIPIHGFPPNELCSIAFECLARGHTHDVKCVPMEVLCEKTPQWIEEHHDTIVLTLDVTIGCTTVQVCQTVLEESAGYFRVALYYAQLGHFFMLLVSCDDWSRLQIDVDFTSPTELCRLLTTRQQRLFFAEVHASAEKKCGAVE